MKSIILSTLLLLFSSVAISGPYIATGLGSTKYDYSNQMSNLFDDGANPALNIGVGWNFASVPWLSVEGTYTDFGDADRRFDLGRFGTIDTNFDANAVGLWAVGSWHMVTLGNMPLYGTARLGVVKGNSDISLTATDMRGRSTTVSDGDDDTGAAGGLGLALGVGQMTAVTLEYREHRLSHTVGGQSFDYDPGVVLLGIKHAF